MNPMSQGMKVTPVGLAFLSDCRRLSIESLIPLKTIRSNAKTSHKYQQIMSSVKEVGLIEPPAVMLAPKQTDRYFLLDGHIRIEVLKDLGVDEVDCLIAPADDTYTYNKRVNRLSAVQDHRMIVQAIERGVSPERLGAALGLSASTISQHSRMLDGIAPEVAERLADKPCSAKAFRVMRQMKPARQIEAAELMTGQKNYSVAFVNAMLAATSPALLVHNKNSKGKEKVSADSMAKMEREISDLQTRNRQVEETYGPDVLQLTIVKGYISALLGKASIVRWLARHRSEYLQEFQSLAEITVLPVVSRDSPAAGR